MNKIRIIVCDDMPQICRHFKKIIDSCDGMEVVATAYSGKEVEALAKEKKPDIILMDIQMESEIAGIEACERIVDNDENVKIIMLTVHKEDELIFKSYGAGAVDYLIKTEDDEEIIKSIRNVHNEQFFIRPNIAQKLITEFSKLHKNQESILYTISLIMSLTNSELEILKLINKGLKRKEIADKRNVEMVTVNTQIRNILKKLGYQNTKELLLSLKKMKIFDLID